MKQDSIPVPVDQRMEYAGEMNANANVSTVSHSISTTTTTNPHTHCTEPRRLVSDLTAPHD